MIVAPVDQRYADGRARECPCDGQAAEAAAADENRGERLRGHFAYATTCVGTSAEPLPSCGSRATARGAATRSVTRWTRWWPGTKRIARNVAARMPLTTPVTID